MIRVGLSAETYILALSFITLGLTNDSLMQEIHMTERFNEGFLMRDGTVPFGKGDKS